MFTGFSCQFPCSKCFTSSLTVDNTRAAGYAIILKLACSSCRHLFSFETSPQLGCSESSRPPNDINRRFVQTFAYMGKGHRGLESLSMGLNMKPITIGAYNKHKRAICNAISQDVQESLEKARCEVKKSCADIDEVFSDKPVNIAVSYNDGSWHKRGFTSKYDVGCCIEVTTVHVIDIEVLSKYCGVCERKKTLLGKNSKEFLEWFEHHKHNCDCNYNGSPLGMETAAAEILWRQSENYGLRYTTIVSDGDAKTFAHLNTLGTVFMKGKSWTRLSVSIMLLNGSELPYARK